MNVLFLSVDDLRPQLGCYGLGWMKTPNLDALAASGTLFERAYCQYPICGPSRASLLSGVRPTATRFRKWNVRIDEDMPDVLTLPEHFRNHGYATQCLGKVFHELFDNRQAWSRKPWLPEGALGGAPLAYALEENRKTSRENGRGPAFESAAVEDAEYGDGRIAQRAVEELRSLATENKPFFLAVGFLKPHLPFNAPEKYWSLYQDVPLASNPSVPRDVPPEALHEWQELRNYPGMPKTGPLDEEQAKTLIWGYAACVSYLDAQVGKVLDELNRLGLRENTMIVLWADHGWQLGEHGLWAKHCLFDHALRCPLIVRVPGLPSGQRAPGLAENLDIYPTLCELAGLSVPAHVQGRSLAPQLRDAASAGKEAVYSRMEAGDSVKTARYRYSEWTDEKGAVCARMLFDHRNDPEENINIAEAPAHRQIVSDHSALLAAMRTGKT